MASTEETPAEDLDNKQKEKVLCENTEAIPTKRKRSDSETEDLPEKRTKSEDGDDYNKESEEETNGKDDQKEKENDSNNVKSDAKCIANEEGVTEELDTKKDETIASDTINNSGSEHVNEGTEKSIHSDEVREGREERDSKSVGATETKNGAKEDGDESEMTKNLGDSGKRDEKWNRMKAKASNETKPSENGDTVFENSAHRSRKRNLLPTEVKVNGVSDSKPDDDSSTVKSEDSEKENRRVDMDIPMDLSTKSNTSTTNGNDIITLSDSESEEEPMMMNGDYRELSREEIVRRRKLIKHFESELRNEEAKLVLLKKLKQSQISHQLQEHTSVNNKQPVKQSSQPPPLVRGSQQQPPQARPAHAHSQPPQLMRGNQMPQSSRTHQQGPPPLVNMTSQRIDNRRMPHMNYQGGMSSSPSHGSHGSILSNYRQSQSSRAAQAAAAAQQQADNQTPAQRQAAAKMALRKQLEKTLLQIPPPKPPPPEMNFIPSLGSPDFISLLGLEEAVNYIIDAALISKGQKNPDEKMVCNPFTCIQCSTDFTPVWKREKAGSKNVICENCVTTNQKKALKQEHTNRLKSAFVKALQQEQEIERMQSQTTQSSSSSNANSSSSSSSSLQQPSQPSANSSSNSASNNMSSGSSPSLPSVYKASPETIRQNFIQAHQAAAAHQSALSMSQPLGVGIVAPFAAAAAAARGAFPYQLPYHGAKPSDLQLQRQYLLDMIPKQGAMSWRP